MAQLARRVPPQRQAERGHLLLDQTAITVAYLSFQRLALGFRLAPIIP